MAILAVRMVGELQLLDLALFFQRVVAFTAFFDRVGVLPDVFPIFILVMTISTGDLILIRMFFMA